MMQNRNIVVLLCKVLILQWIFGFILLQLYTPLYYTKLKQTTFGGHSRQSYESVSTVVASSTDFKAKKK